MTSMDTSKNSLIHSYGIIPIYQNSDGKSEYLVVQNHGGFWGFPKGGPNDNEEPADTALRELKEETGISVDPSSLNDSISYEYEIQKDDGPKHKKVCLFPVVVNNKAVNLQESELQNYRWVKFDEALELIDLDTLKNSLENIKLYE